MTKTNKKLSTEIRIFLLIIGFSGAIALFVFGFNPALNMIMSFAGYDITKYFIGFIIVVFGLIFSSLIKSGILGKWKLD